MYEIRYDITSVCTEDHASVDLMALRDWYEIRYDVTSVCTEGASILLRFMEIRHTSVWLISSVDTWWRFDLAKMYEIRYDVTSVGTDGALILLRCYGNKIRHYICFDHGGHEIRFDLAKMYGNKIRHYICWGVLMAVGFDLAKMYGNKIRRYICWWFMKIRYDATVGTDRVWFTDKENDYCSYT